MAGSCSNDVRRQRSRSGLAGRRSQHERPAGRGERIDTPGDRMTTDDERIAYLATGAGTRLHPDDQAELDDLRNLLSDPSVWEDPDPSLEERVVAAITAEARATDPAPRRRFRPVNVALGVA